MRSPALPLGRCGHTVTGDVQSTAQALGLDWLDLVL
eukprot:COSAG02_NODE_7196_length_3125_cov_1.842697_6_plen_35_part_01